MNKKEIAEIRKQCKKGDNSFRKICGCYVHGEDRERDFFVLPFQTLPEEDNSKYIDIFKKTLSGGLNKNLFNLPLPNQSDIRDQLEKIRRSDMEDKDLMEEVCGIIAEQVTDAENYAAFLILNSYDVPGNTSDGQEMEDTSEEVYTYLMCAVCPVTLTDPGLGYTGAESDHYFSSLERSWLVHMPKCGFLYPAFNDRSTDINSVLYYSANAKNLCEDFVRGLFEAELPHPADHQKESFCKVAESALGSGLDYDTACAIKESLNEIAADAANAIGNPEAGLIGKRQVRNLLESASGKELPTDDFEQIFQKIVETDGKTAKEELFVSNINDAKSFEVRTDSAQIRINTEMAGAPEIRVINEKKYILVPVDGEMLVNGIQVRP